jgi:hypothetical protein
MRVSINLLAGSRRVLAGAQAGRDLFAALVANTPASTEPTAWFLDFSGIEVATSSFLRESVIAYRDYTHTSRKNIYPVVANAKPAVLEELEFFLNQRRDAFWCCTLDAAGNCSNARVLGELDPIEKVTLQLVAQMGTASAPELATRERDASKIGPTGWNNRLASLGSKRLIVEHRTGKTKLFNALLETS